MCAFQFERHAFFERKYLSNIDFTVDHLYQNHLDRTRHYFSYQDASTMSLVDYDYESDEAIPQQQDDDPMDTSRNAKRPRDETENSAPTPAEIQADSTSPNDLNPPKRLKKNEEDEQKEPGIALDSFFDSGPGTNNVQMSDAPQLPADFDTNVEEQPQKSSQAHLIPPQVRYGK
jgi:hypothetical protein